MNGEDETKNSIDDLITYAEPEDDTPEEETYTETDEDVFSPDDDTEYADDDEYDDEYDGEYYDDENDGAYHDDGYDDGYDDEYYDDEYDDEYYGDEYDNESEPQNEKGLAHTKTIIIIFGLIALVAVIILFITVDDGFIGTIKSNFSQNFTAIFGRFMPDEEEIPVLTGEDEDSRYETDVRNAVTVAPRDTSHAQFAPYKDGVVCASSNHISYIDSAGSIVWEYDTIVVDPLLSVDGSYILIAEKGRHRICLYNGNKLLYDVEDPDIIAAVQVSPSGDAVAVTSKQSYKGGISVYNKSGEQIYSWSSGRDAVISADISSPSRNVAVALLNTETNAKSVIQIFDVNNEQSHAQINIEDTVIFDLKFTGNTLNAFGDNRIVILSDNGSIISDTDFSKVQLTHSAIDASGNKVMSMYDGMSPVLKLYGKNGSEDGSFVAKGIIDHVDIEGRIVLFNIGRDVYCGRMNTDSFTKYTAAMDVKKLMLITQNTFAIVYSNSVEIVKL